MNVSSSRPRLKLLRLPLLFILGALCVLRGSTSEARGNKVTNRDDRTFLIDDKPFFPIGLYYAEEEIADESGALLKDLRAMGFNTIFYHIADGNIDGAKATLDRIAAAGLHTQFRPPGQLQFQFDDLRKAVTLYKDHPAMLLCEHGDEPMVNKINVEQIAPGYKLMKELDPHHPVLLVEYPYWHNEPELKRFAQACDVYAFDFYPIPLKRWMYQGKDIPHGWPHSIAIMGEVTAWWQTLAPGKPTISILQAWNRNPHVDGKAGHPTVAQSRFMAYQCVIRGAKGLLYYGKIRVKAPHTPSGLPAEIDPDPNVTAQRFKEAVELNDAFWAEFKPVVKELDAMTPVFTARDADWRPEVTLAPGSKAKPADIQLVVKQLDHGTVILLVNASEHPAEISLNVPRLANATPQGWNGSPAPRGPEKGNWQDTVEPFGVRVWADHPQKKD